MSGGALEPGSAHGRPDRAGDLPALAALPALTLALSLAFAAAAGPHWLGLNSDPDYAYLLNALNVARGEPPGHTDHPGTLVQGLGACVLLGFHAAAGRGDLAGDVVGRPETYLRAIQVLLLTLHAGALAWLGVAARRFTGSVRLALVCQAGPLLSATVLPHLVGVKPEPVLATLGALVAAVALRTASSQVGARSWRAALAFGLLAGATLATKATGLPLLVIPLLLLAGAPALAAFAASGVASAALCTAPAWPVIGRFFTFSGALATHLGRYGEGPGGLVDGPAYLGALGRLAASEPSLLAGLAAAAALPFLEVRPEERGARRVALALAASQLGSLLLVARHPSDQYLAPGDHYLVPALALTGGTWALAGSLLLRRLEARAAAWLGTGRARAMTVALGAAVVLGLGAGLHRQHAHLEDQRLAQLEAVAYRAAFHPHANVISYYRSSSPSYALSFGNGFAAGRYSALIAASHPRAISYNIWADALEAWRSDPAVPGPDGRVSFVLQGTPFPPERLERLRLPGRPALVGGNRREAVYELR